MFSGKEIELADFFANFLFSCAGTEMKVFHSFQDRVPG